MRQEKLFKVSKKGFTTKLILLILDLDKRIKIEVDKLDYVIKEVLLIEYINERLKLVAYLLKLLNEIKLNLILLWNIY